MTCRTKKSYIILGLIVFFVTNNTILFSVFGGSRVGSGAGWVSFWNGGGIEPGSTLFSFLTIQKPYDDQFVDATSSSGASSMTIKFSEENLNNPNNVIHLRHVLNPFVMTQEGNNHGNLTTTEDYDPLGLEQRVAFTSIQRELEQCSHPRHDNNTKNRLGSSLGLQSTSKTHHDSSTRCYSKRHGITLSIEVICATYESDRGVLQQLLSGKPCHKFVLLEKSTQELYPHLQPPRDLPILQEIINATTKRLVKEDAITDDYYWIYTNSDIGVTKSFYLSSILTNIKIGYDAFTINRMTIDISSTTMTTKKNNQDDTKYWINFVDRNILTAGKSHPGYDCFIVHSSVLQRFHFGMFFVGHPPWGHNLHQTLAWLAQNYTNIKSNRHGTFHLGNERSWTKRQTTKNDTSTSGIKKSGNDQRLTIWDPISAKQCLARPAVLTMYSIQNTINCGKWFHHYGRKYEDRFIPNFVTEGYEPLFINRSSHIFYYTEDGYPYYFQKSTKNNITKLSQKFIRKNFHKRSGGGMTQFSSKLKNRQQLHQGTNFLDVTSSSSSYNQGSTGRSPSLYRYQRNQQKFRQQKIDSFRQSHVNN